VRCRRVGWSRASGCACGWTRAARSMCAATPTRWPAGWLASRWRHACTPSGSRCGTPSVWWKRCRGCVGVASTGSSIVTSSTGWCASRGPSPIIAIARIYSRAVVSAWPMTCCGNGSRSGRPGNTCTSCTWRRGGRRAASRRRWGGYWQASCR
jgi:hypothetical protein